MAMRWGERTAGRPRQHRPSRTVRPAFYSRRRVWQRGRCLAPRPRASHITVEEETPAYLVFEWLVVEAFARASDRNAFMRTPGIGKAQEVRDTGNVMSARTYLRVPTVFGFNGVYKPLAQALDIVREVDDQFHLRDAGYELLRVWQEEQKRTGFLDSSLGQATARPFARRCAPRSRTAFATASPRERGDGRGGSCCRVTSRLRPWGRAARAVGRPGVTRGDSGSSPSAGARRCGAPGGRDLPTLEGRGDGPGLEHRVSRARRRARDDPGRAAFPVRGGGWRVRPV